MKREIIYLQIDFLRLFRLARRLKYINRNRAMPSRYDNIDDAVNCCKRLMRSILLKVFPSNIASIKTYGSEFRITFDKKYIDLFNFFTNYIWDKDEEEIKKIFCLLCRSGLGLRMWLTSTNTYNICISTTMFNTLINGYRTAHRFYDVFLETLEYKKLWDSIIPELFIIMNKELENNQKASKVPIQEILTKTQETLKTPTQKAFDAALAKYLKRKNI